MKDRHAVITAKAWQKIGSYEVEYACDYYLDKRGEVIGNSGCYYTGRSR